MKTIRKKVREERPCCGKRVKRTTKKKIVKKNITKRK